MENFLFFSRQTLKLDRQLIARDKSICTLWIIQLAWFGWNLDKNRVESMVRDFNGALVDLSSVENKKARTYQKE